MKAIAPFRSVVLGSVALVGCQAATPPTPAPARPQIGLQAYTYRELTVAQTIEKAEALGIRYLQLYPGQRLGPDKEPFLTHTIDEATRAGLLAHARAHHVELVSYGVVGGKDEADWRQIFAFAKAMGMQNIASEPPDTVFPMVARLASESGIAVTIHNHALPTRYADPEVALAAIKPYPNFGLCADTGHWARSGYDPVAKLRLAAGRITSLHLKDVAERGVKKARDVPWGTGVCDVAGQILELRRQGFTGIAFVEYEFISPSLDAELAQCVDYFHRLVAASDADLMAGRIVPAGFNRKPDEPRAAGAAAP